MVFNSSDLTGFLNELCDLASVETLSRFRKSVDITNKLSEGFDPVTEADRAAERVIRNHILNRFEDHGVLGEEFGATNADAEYQWIIDPIDGTRAFISGLPTWGTLIGLYLAGKPHAGVMYQPFTGERYICDGKSSFLSHNGDVKQLQTSSTLELGDAIIMTTSPALFYKDEIASYERLEELCKLPRYGADCYAYCMLASGNIDLVVESGLNAYDIAALIPIVEKSGGVFTDWQGGSPAQGGQVLVAANKTLHEKALQVLAG